MTELSLPFWIVVERNGSGQPAAFTTTEKLSAFLGRERSGSWGISLIADPMLLVLAVADLHQQGAATVWVDPNHDATESDSILLVDLVDLSERLGAA